jgi:cell division septum initiation protein DivIVA
VSLASGGMSRGSAGSASSPSFGIVLRGYERREVDKHIDRLLSARHNRQPLPPDAARPNFTIVLRGYDPGEVDTYIRNLVSHA